MKLLRKISGNKPAIIEPLIHFNDGPVIENPEGNPEIEVAFYLGERCVYRCHISGNEWAKASIKYLQPWRVVVTAPNHNYSLVHHFDLKDRTVRINFDSKSLGDTLAWLPQVAKFATQHRDTRVVVSTFWDELKFDKSYPELMFIAPDKDLPNCYASFQIGCFFDQIPDRHPRDPRLVPLAQIASDILAIDYKETRTRLPMGTGTRPSTKPYVCIATSSTAACKLWLLEGGWQAIIDWLNDNGFAVVVIQKELNTFSNVIDRSGDHDITHRITELRHCDFFIGLGSGLSWLAWAVAKPVILISGFSAEFSEFQSLCYRVSNTKVCHGCWANPEYTFNRGDWNWCPNHQGTQRQHECSRAISVEMVISKIQAIVDSSPAIADTNLDKNSDSGFKK